MGEQHLPHGHPRLSHCQLNLHPSVDHRALVAADGLPAATEAMTGAEIKTLEVTGAGDRPVPDQPAGKRDVAVRALIIDRAWLTVGEHDAQRVAVVSDPARGAVA